MPLDRYREKRDFAKTPEPPGRARPRAGKARFFCVQKHLATQLHYDFRLEHDGVLLSWAVPKGPSLDPTVRRLAMHVEDHPVEYGTFEGVIPEGYGAGIVLLWDRGTWEPEVDDVDAALRRGDLKFHLNGYKLKGSWVLVRTRGNRAAGVRQSAPGEPDRTWLLIKHRDEWSGPVDVTEFGMSVKSGGDFADILAQDAPDVWRSNKPGRGGEAGALLARIIERAEALRQEAAERDTERATAARAKRAKATPTQAKAAEAKPTRAKAAARTRKAATARSPRARAEKPRAKPSAVARRARAKPKG